MNFSAVYRLRWQRRYGASNKGGVGNTTSYFRAKWVSIWNEISKRYVQSYY